MGFCISCPMLVLLHQGWVWPAHISLPIETHNDLQTDRASSAVCFRTLDCFMISTKHIEKKIFPNSLSYFFLQLCHGWTNPFLCLIPMWEGDKLLRMILPILPYYDSVFLCVLTQQPDGPRLLTITLIIADALLPSTFAASHSTSELN